jgi:hypothetical protein
MSNKTMPINTHQTSQHNKKQVSQQVSQCQQDSENSPVGQELRQQIKRNGGAPHTKSHKCAKCQQNTEIGGNSTEEPEDDNDATTENEGVSPTVFVSKGSPEESSDKHSNEDHACDESYFAAEIE